MKLATKISPEVLPEDVSMTPPQIEFASLCGPDRVMLLRPFLTRVSQTAASKMASFSERGWIFGACMRTPVICVLAGAGRGIFPAS